MTTKVMGFLAHLDQANLSMDLLVLDMPSRRDSQSNTERRFTHHQSCWTG